MPRKARHSKKAKMVGRSNRFGTGSIVQSGVLRYRMTDFIDYTVPKTTQTNDSIAQYGLAPINTIPGMFGTSDDLKKLSLPACQPCRLNLSVIPYAGVPNPEKVVFTVRSACPIAYPTLLGTTNPAVTAAWNQQSTVVTPNVNPTFVRVATWDFRKMPSGTVFQTASDTSDLTAVMGMVNWQVLNVNSDEQYRSDDVNNSVLQFKIEIEFDLPMPALSQVRNFVGQVDGDRYFTEFNTQNRAGDSNVYLILEGSRRTTETLPDANTVHGRMRLRRLAREQLAKSAEEWPPGVMDPAWTDDYSDTSSEVSRP